MTVRATLLGHATVLLELGETRIVIDPLFRSTLVLGAFTRAEEPPAPPERPDAILVSHQHPDHLDFRSIRQLGDGVPVVAPSGSGRLLQRHGIGDVRELAPGESTAFGAVEVVATPAVHDGRRWPIGRHAEPLGYELRAEGARIYFAGDTDLFDGMRELAGVDLALLPIAGIGPSVGAGHLDPERAVKAAAMLRPRVVVPIHWGTFLRADLHRRRPELLTEPPTELKRLMAEREPGVEVRVLRPGEGFVLAEA